MAVIEQWATDEHRLGLQPILRRVWARRGQRLLAPVQPRYQWLYLVGFVRPLTGQTEWQWTSTVNVEVFTVVLNQFAQAVGAGSDKQILLVLDNAGWHTSATLTVPDGIHLHFLPPYTPELQPAERLWSLADAPLANRHFATLDALEEAHAQRCAQLQQQPDLIRRYTHYHWWSATA